LWKEWQFHSTGRWNRKVKSFPGKDAISVPGEILGKYLSCGKSGSSTPPVGGIEKLNLSQGKTLYQFPEKYSASIFLVERVAVPLHRSVE
jgi:hypothetical protein